MKTKTARPPSLSSSVLRAAACLGAGLALVGAVSAQPETALPVYEPRESGPVRAGRGPDRILENFTGAVPKTAAFGKAAFTAAVEPGGAPFGGNSLHVNLPATGLGGGHGVSVELPMPENSRDWSGNSRMEIWLLTPKGGAIDRGGEGGIGGYRLVAQVRDGSGLWHGLAMMVRPYLGGVWQPVDVELENPQWYCKEKDQWRKPDWRSIDLLRLEIPGHLRHEVDVRLADVGLKRAAATGPSLLIQSRGAGFLTVPGSQFPIQMVVDRLPEGREARASVDVRDFWGKSIFTRTETFSGGTGPREKEISIPVASPGFFEISAELSVDGKPVFRSYRGLASLRPLTPEQRTAGEASVFGIWPGIDDVLGACYVRKGLGEPESGEDITAGRWAPASPPPGHLGVCWVTGPRHIWKKRYFETPGKPEQWGAFGQFLETAARMAADGRFPYYEVINEPNAHYWGPMENLVDYHRVVYEAVKRGDPKAKVGGPSPYNIDADYVEKFLAAGGDKWVDAIIVHGYHEEEDFQNRLRALKAMLARRGLAGKEILITEVGRSIPNVTAEDQARAVARYYVIAMSEGVRMMMWHCFEGIIDRPGDRPVNNADADFNIMRSDNTPNPAYVAYGTMTRTLLGTVYAGPIEGLPEGCAGYAFKKPDGSRVLALWKKAPGSGTARLAPGGGKAVCRDIMGVDRTVEADARGLVSLTLTENPVYLITGTARERDQTIRQESTIRH